MFRTELPVLRDLRAEEALSVALALSVAAVAGVGVALRGLRIDQSKYWDLSFILLPVALLVFLGSLRYAFSSSMAGGPGLAAIGRVFRNWLPFLFFFMAYETFHSTLLQVVLGRDRDAALLHADQMMFGQTPSVAMQAIISPTLTTVMTLAYFLHLLLPPFIAVVWYYRDLTVFRECLLAILMSAVFASAGYMAVPAVGPAAAYPQLFSTSLSGDVYESVTLFVDTARTKRDVFPSLHVGISTIVLYYGWRRGRGWFALLLPLVLANWVSTIYLRYHYFIDVIAGWGAAALSIGASKSLLRLERLWRGPGDSVVIPSSDFNQAQK